LLVCVFFFIVLKKTQYHRTYKRAHKCEQGSNLKSKQLTSYSRWLENYLKLIQLKPCQAQSEYYQTCVILHFHTSIVCWYLHNKSIDSSYLICAYSIKLSINSSSSSLKWRLELNSTWVTSFEFHTQLILLLESAWLYLHASLKCKARSWWWWYSRNWVHNLHLNTNILIALLWDIV